MEGFDKVTKLKLQMERDPEYNKAVVQTQNAKMDLDKAKKEYEKQLQVVNKKQQEVDAIQDKIDSNEMKIKENENKIEENEDEMDAIDDAIEEKQEENEKLKEEYEKLKDDDSYFAQEQKKSIEEKMKANEEAIKQMVEKKDKLKKENEELKKENEKLEKENDKLEDEKDKKEDELDDEKDKLEDKEDALDDAQDKYNEAKEHEKEVAEEQAEKYPDSFGKVYKQYNQAIIDKQLEEEKKKKEAEEKAKKEQLEQEKKSLVEGSELTEEQKQQALQINDIDELKKFIKKTELKNQIAADEEKIKDIEKKLMSGDISLEEKQKLQQQLVQLKKDEEALKKELNKNPDEEAQKMINSLLDANAQPPKSGVLLWDSPSFNINGRLEDIIAEHMQPKLKFAYIGEFPEKLSNLDWMVKSMDKPKINIEYVEQVRSNVIRYYPVKVEHGELSVTFWDDMKNKTVNTIYAYYTGDIFNHPSVEVGAQLLLRDGVVIPSFAIYELVADFYNGSEGHLKYTFENASLSSFDLDNSEDESDEGVHTIQMVFKVERFTVEPADPRTLNIMNDPKWL